MKIVYIYLTLLLSFLSGFTITAQQTVKLEREYRFNNNLNENIKGKNAVAQSTITFVEDRFGNPTGALSFTGKTDNYVKTPKFFDHDMTKGYAITFWVYIDKPIAPCSLSKPDPNCIQEMFFVNQVAESLEISHLGMRRNGNRLSLISKPSSPTLTSFELWFWDPVKFASKGWYFVALSYEKNAMQVSIGNPEGKLSSRRNYFAPKEISESFIWGIGARYENPVDRIDDFKVYNGPLLIEEVQKNYENEQGFSTRKNYVIKAVHSGKALTANGIGHNKSVVQKSFNPVNEKTQYWSLLESKGANVVAGEQLYIQSSQGLYINRNPDNNDVKVNSAAFRNLVILVPGKNNDKQYYNIIDKQTGHYLTINGTNDDAKAVFSPLNNTDNQRFTFEENTRLPEIPILTDGQYYIGVQNNVVTGFSLVNKEFKVNNNADFINPNEKNKWDLKYLGNGNYNIRIDGQYLSATDATDSNHNGTLHLSPKPMNSIWKLRRRIFFLPKSLLIDAISTYYLFNTNTGYMIGLQGTNNPSNTKINMSTPAFNDSDALETATFYFLPVENVNTAPADPNASNRGIYIKNYSDAIDNEAMAVSKDNMNAVYKKIDSEEKNRSQWILDRELRNNEVYEYSIAGMGYQNSKLYLTQKKSDAGNTGFKPQKTFYTIIKMGHLNTHANKKRDIYLIRNNSTNQFLTLDNIIKFVSNNDLKIYEHGFYFEEVPKPLQYGRIVTITEFSPGSCMYNAETHMDPTLIINAPSNESHFLYNGEWDNYTASSPGSWVPLETSVNCSTSNSFIIETNDFSDSTVLGVQTFEKNSNGCKRAVSNVDKCNVHVPRFDFNLKMNSVNILKLGETRYRYQVINYGETIPPAQSITKKAVEEPKNVAVIDTEEVILSPNPTDDIVNISWGGFNGFHSVCINSLQGKVIKKIKLSSKNQQGIQVDVQDIPKGMYLVKIYGSAKTVTKKLIIK